MAKVGKFYKIGSNDYFVSEKTTRECWGGASQVTLRVVVIDRDKAKYSLRPDFVGGSDLPEPVFDRVAEEIE